MKSLDFFPLVVLLLLKYNKGKFLHILGGNKMSKISKFIFIGIVVLSIVFSTFSVVSAVDFNLTDSNTEDDTNSSNISDNNTSSNNTTNNTSNQTSTNTSNTSSNTNTSSSNTSSEDSATVSSTTSSDSELGLTNILNILIIVIGILLILLAIAILIIWIFPPTHKMLVDLYTNNNVIKAIINVLGNVIQGLWNGIKNFFIRLFS